MKKEFYKRKSEIQTIGEAMGDMLDAFKIKKKFNQTHIIESWNELMGTAIARQTREIFFKDKKLFVRIDSGALKQELSMHKGMVVEKLNKFIGEEVVKEVIFL
jgi:predicted nucleic acid-binding Zn ribbon protein